MIKMATQKNQLPNKEIQSFNYEKTDVSSLEKPKNEWTRKLDSMVTNGYGPENVKVLTVSFVRLIDNVTLAFRMVDHCGKIDSIQGYYEVVKLLIYMLYSLTEIDQDDWDRLKKVCDERIDLIVYKERINVIYERYKKIVWIPQVNEPRIPYNRENEYAYELLRVDNLSGSKSLKESAYRNISQDFEELDYGHGLEDDLKVLRSSRPDIPFKLYQGLSSGNPTSFYKQCATYLRTASDDDFILHKICSSDELYNMMAV
ncbi:hypothetical protein QK685_sRNA6bgp1 [Perilla mosaic virus]|uniref:Uncharacterized protein n=1 Tax=Perilla mosaic virus TaxID=2483037 RepID=A0A6F8PH38_9VIRU|nr:hypothetical protein QK685_sRNA6bgp1 [Perilla mosaic virus]BBM96184.1 hypothetical protein [Perilla mosaic virus]